jgi:hypothetical protein
MTQLGLQLSSWMMVTTLLCLLLLLCFSVSAQADKKVMLTRDSSALQSSKFPGKDSIQRKSDSIIKNHLLPITAHLHDTMPSMKKLLKENITASTKLFQSPFTGHAADSAGKLFSNRAASALTAPVKKEKQSIMSLLGFFRKKRIDTLPNPASANNLFSGSVYPLLRYGGGYINYNYNYRSLSDTPFAEQNIGQHNINGSMGVVLANKLPVNINFFIRRSNSLLFRDITDIQVSFDPAAFRNGLVENLQHRVKTMIPSISDSLMHALDAVKSVDLPKTSGWLSSAFNSQRVREYREMIQINEMHPENMPTDSVARMEKQSQLKEAALFIQLYDSTRLRYDSLLQMTSLLETQLNTQRRKLAGYRQTLNGRFSNWSSYGNWRTALNEYDPGGLQVPDKYKWLMGIRSLSVGKTPLNYSELTAKNIGLTGLNFEYNSWYYLALAAGTIDYRFRDFITGPRNRSHQYLVMLRAGLGHLEKNYFIVSFFKGQKQLSNLPGNNSFPNSITISGITAETKWQVNPHTYFIAEAGESIAPDFRSTPVSRTGKFTLNGKLNKALSIKLYSAFPKIGGRLEGLYKYTGANYQSFSSFQSNAAINTWYLKWEQGFFKRQLKITGSLRSNEFSNPYILQQYKSNTVFKSIAAVLRIRKWPMISFGYMPMSQLSIVGQQVVENRFQTLTASLNHFYRIGNRQAFTSFIFNRFYNTGADSGFIYFNASNMYLSQTVAFKLFTAGIGVSDSRSTQYHLTSGEITLQVPFLKKAVAGLSLKVNHLNGYETKTGGKCRFDFNITHRDRIGVDYEKAWLPGNGSHLINSDIGNVLYTRSF